jgi:hypothetical protein
MSSNLFSLNHPTPQTSSLSRETIEAGIEYFEHTFHFTIKKGAHRERFVSRDYASLIELGKDLLAYKVFGELRRRAVRKTLTDVRIND